MVVRIFEDLWTRTGSSRMAHQSRVKRLLELEIEFIPVDDFDEMACYGIDLNDVGMGHLDEATEKSLFLAMNAAKQSVAEKRAILNADSPDLVLLDELESSWQRASLIRHQLIVVFFKLAVVVGRRFSHDPNDADDLIGQACLTMIRAVERFDASRGFRFSSYATRAIRSELTRYVTRQRRHGWVSLELTDLAAIRDTGTRHPELVRRSTTFNALEDLLQRLEKREEHVVRSRFGLQNRPGCFTLQRLADEYGVTRERIRQLERRALKKLRQMATESESWGLLHWYADQ